MRIHGVTRNQATIDAVLAEDVCDVAGPDPALLAGCEVIVLCTHVDVMPVWMRACAEHAPQALVTDAGSTKAWVCEQAIAILPAGRFLGGHPMAGREHSGYDAADPELFRGAPWVLTPRDAADLDRFSAWRAAVTRIGAEVVTMDPSVHDESTALVSHMPFALSAALMRCVAAAPRWEQGGALAATGLRDMVRLAGGDPDMYAAITATNTAPLLAALDALEQELRALRAAIDGGATHQYFAQARELRRGWLESRAQQGRPLP